MELATFFGVGIDETSSRICKGQSRGNSESKFGDASVALYDIMGDAGAL